MTARVGVCLSRVSKAFHPSRLGYHVLHHQSYDAISPETNALLMLARRAWCQALHGADTFSAGLPSYCTQWRRKSPSEARQKGSISIHTEPQLEVVCTAGMHTWSGSTTAKGKSVRPKRQINQTPHSQAPPRRATAYSREKQEGRQGGVVERITQAIDFNSSWKRYAGT